MQFKTLQRVMRRGLKRESKRCQISYDIYHSRSKIKLESIDREANNRLKKKK